MATVDIAEALSRKLDESAPELSKLDSYYAGKQPAAFLSEDARTALGNKFRSLAVNFPRLVVDSYADRLKVAGFRLDGPDGPADDDLWRIWRLNDMVEGSTQAHIEALVLGRSFVIVWGRENNPRVPLITVESAHQMAVQRDPATREVVAAFKRWVDGGKAYSVVYEPTQITHLVSKGAVPQGGVVPPTGWEAVKTLPNPLGVVPVVPLVNRGRLLDMDGVSEMADVLDLTDAINKVSTDMLVTSEFYARPRRWVTGLEVIEDEEGNVVNPFASEASRVWQAEPADAKFGQFDAARLDGYSDALATLTQQLGALTGLPPHYLGLHGDQPPSADAIRSAEASLVSTALQKQRQFGAAWADVARLILAVRDGVDPTTIEVETVWESAETRTPAQAADAAVKQAQIGVPLTMVAEEVLGYSPEKIARMRELRRAEALDAAGVNLAEILP